MRERGDLTVLHEPFMYFHYLTNTRARFPHFDPDPAHPVSYEGIRDMILKLAEDGPVFVKDMAYYVLPELLDDLAFARSARHAFLVRDPAEAILSYAKLDPDFTVEELGIESQWRLLSGLNDAGKKAAVMLSAAIRADPEASIGSYWQAMGLSPKPDAFKWGDALPDGWKHVKGWHGEVLRSGAIRPPDEDRDVASKLAALPERFNKMWRHHQKFYERLVVRTAY